MCSPTWQCCGEQGWPRRPLHLPKLPGPRPKGMGITDPGSGSQVWPSVHTPSLSPLCLVHEHLSCGPTFSASCWGCRHWDPPDPLSFLTGSCAARPEPPPSSQPPIAAHLGLPRSLPGRLLRHLLLLLQEPLPASGEGDSSAFSHWAALLDSEFLQGGFQLQTPGLSFSKGLRRETRAQSWCLAAPRKGTFPSRTPSELVTTEHEAQWGPGRRPPLALEGVSDRRGGLREQGAPHGCSFPLGVRLR